MSRLLIVSVSIYIEDDADPDAVIEGLDYSFDHPAIIDQELLEYYEVRQPRNRGQMPLDL
jgi:hypothetical protein